MDSRPDLRIPTVHTRRLRLVAWEERHFDSFLELHADVDTMLHIGEGRPMDQVEAWLHLAMLVGHWGLRGYGVWAVEELASGALVGRAGLFHPAGWPDPELNWMIVPAWRGQGLATEVARAALDFTFNTLGIETVISLVRPENTASARVALKLGATLADTIEFMQAPMQVFRYSRLAACSRTGLPR